MEDDEAGFIELYTHHGVLVEEVKPCKKDIDFHHNLGTISVVEYKSDLGKCIEWHQCRVSIESDYQEWAIVENKNDHTQDSNDTSRNSKKPIVQMKIKDFLQMKMSNNRKKLTISTIDTDITFYFQNGSAESFMIFLKGMLNSSLRQTSSNVYVKTSQKEFQNLEKSFAELNLFPDDNTRSYVLWNFVKRFQESPYETTMDTFSKVTNTILNMPQYQSEDDRSALLHPTLTSDDLNDVHNGKVSSEDYELITKVPPLPPRTLPERCEPLNREQWQSAFDEHGRIPNPDFVKEIVFHGGITSEGDLRKEVWKYLLGYYPWNATSEEREVLKREKTEEYFVMKSQWETMTPSQIERFSAYKEQKNLIEKDVHRTDRNMEFFAGDENPNLALLQDILMTYVMYNFDLGYVQGMNDLLSPLLVQLQDEVDTFWCFVGFMNKVSRNFEIDQAGMKEQFHQLFCLLCSVEPELSSYLDHHDSKNMSFCFRWLLVWFKREFSYEDIYLIWEVLWTEFVCKNFHLLVSAAILDNEKKTIMTNNFGFPEILKHINELANRMDVELILRRAEGIYIQISNAANIHSAKQIIGLSTGSEGEKEENEMPTKTTGEEESRKKEKMDSEKSFFEDTAEIAFDQSLNMLYL